MTRDEILAMQPGRELDALVAEKVMGYQVHGSFRDAGGIRVSVNRHSTDISAAWEVVEEFIGKRGRGFSLGRASVKYEPDRKWNARIGTDEWVEADTAPEAICKAALLAVIDQN